MTSYLTNRTQKTKVNNIFSNTKCTSAGVQQGSVLGSLLFNIFINDVFQFITSNTEKYLYADDTAIIFAADNNTDLQIIINNFFLKYSDWCTSNCVLINPDKSNYLTFNVTNINVTINNQMLCNPSVVKYLGIYIDDRLFWNHQVNHIVKLCSQRIGMFRKVLPYLPKYFILLYYNSFIKSCFSYCLIFWFNNDRSCRYKLINKIDNLFVLLARYCKMNVQDLIVNMHIFSVFNTYKLQCLSFMYDLCNNRISLPYFPLTINNEIHTHFTRGAAHIHINCIPALDKRNFMYQCMLHGPRSTYS